MLFLSCGKPNWKEAPPTTATRRRRIMMKRAPLSSTSGNMDQTEINRINDNRYRNKLIINLIMLILITGEKKIP